MKPYAAIGFVAPETEIANLCDATLSGNTERAQAWLRRALHGLSAHEARGGSVHDKYHRLHADPASKRVAVVIPGQEMSHSTLEDWQKACRDWELNATCVGILESLAITPAAYAEYLFPSPSAQ